MHNVVTPKREHKIVTTNHFLHCTTEWTAVHVRMREQNTPSVQIQTFNSQLKWKNFDLTLQFRCYRSRPNIHTDCWKPTLDVTTVTNLVKQRLSLETNNSFELTTPERQLNDILGMSAKSLSVFQRMTNIQSPQWPLSTMAPNLPQFRQTVMIKWSILDPTFWQC